MQNWKSTLLNKLLFYVPVSHEGIGKAVQKDAGFFLTQQHQKGELQYSDVIDCEFVYKKR